MIFNCLLSRDSDIQQAYPQRSYPGWRSARLQPFYCTSKMFAGLVLLQYVVRFSFFLSVCWFRKICYVAYSWLHGEPKIAFLFIGDDYRSLGNISTRKCFRFMTLCHFAAVVGGCKLVWKKEGRERERELAYGLEPAPKAVGGLLLDQVHRLLEAVALQQK